VATASTPGLAATVGVGGADRSTNLASVAQLRAFEGSKLTAPQAIAAAQAHSNGGELVELKFDATRATPIYKVRTYRDRAVWDSEIDAQSGQLIGAAEVTPVAQLDSDDKSDLAGVVRVPTASLAQAVALAEARGVGKVMSAEVEEVDGKSVYELIVVKDGSAQRLVYRSHYH
jgi:uncharacterized membrane protein YkoI